MECDCGRVGTVSDWVSKEDECFALVAVDSAKREAIVGAFESKELASLC